MGAVFSCFGGATVYLNGRRLRVSPLGEGGFSLIFLAQDQDTHEDFVLKRMTCLDDETLGEAMKEIEFYHHFDHPNIIKCLDSEVLPCPSQPNAKDVYMLLPFYKRGTLQDLIDRSNETGTPLEEDQILDFAEGIANALMALHTHKPKGKSEVVPLAHRDVKPANVLVSKSGVPILMDFGSVTNAIVKIENRAQALALQDLAGERSTMPYRAPELFDVQSHCTVDERVDIWSLGCTIYALAYGQSPFEHVLGETGGSIALAVINGAVTFPQDREYSKDFRDLISYMLNIDPAKRPSIDMVMARIAELRSV